MSDPDRDAVLAANAAFYTAFAAADPDAMDRVWATDRPVACIHPGWPPLTDRAGIMRSWRDIFQNGAPGIHAEKPEVQVHGDTALVVCREVIGPGVLAASNLFVRTGGGWRMVLHQASPIAPRAAQPTPPDRPKVLH